MFLTFTIPSLEGREEELHILDFTTSFAELFANLVKKLIYFFKWVFVGIIIQVSEAVRCSGWSWSPHLISSEINLLLVVPGGEAQRTVESGQSGDRSRSRHVGAGRRKGFCVMSRHWPLLSVPPFTLSLSHPLHATSLPLPPLSTCPCLDGISPSCT